MSTQILDDKYKVGLKEYEETRFNHEECGDIRARLYVKKVPSGIIYWCHNCTAKGFEAVGNRTPSEMAAFLRQLQVEEQQELLVTKLIKLPSDFNFNIPAKGMLWLTKYSITDKERKAFGIGYSNYMNRLILPVYDGNNNLCYWQGRNLGKATKEHPKYLNIKKADAQNVFFRRTLFELDTPLVVVEDILSAIRVGRYANTIALLGSYIPPSFFSFLTSSYKCNKIYLWLDSDKYTDSITYSKKIRDITQISTRVVCTTEDPKQTPDDKIRNILQL